MGDDAAQDLANAPVVGQVGGLDAVVAHPGKNSLLLGGGNVARLGVEIQFWVVLFQALGDEQDLDDVFEDGADGVIVAGCEEGTCHFINGNIKAKKKVNYTKKILDEIGLGGDRLEMYNLSAAMGQKFAELAKEMTERIKKLGPSPAKGE